MKCISKCLTASICNMHIITCEAFYGKKGLC